MLHGPKSFKLSEKKGRHTAPGKMEEGMKGLRPFENRGKNDQCNILENMLHGETLY
jgi:hypothetical protein